MRSIVYVIINYITFKSKNKTISFLQITFSITLLCASWSTFFLFFVIKRRKTFFLPKDLYTEVSVWSTDVGSPTPSAIYSVTSFEGRSRVMFCVRRSTQRTRRRRRRRCCRCVASHRRQRRCRCSFTSEPAILKQLFPWNGPALPRQSGLELWCLKTTEEMFDKNYRGPIL